MTHKAVFRHFRHWAFIAAAFFLVTFRVPALGITINFSYQPGVQDNPELRPSNDPTAARLMTVFAAAAAYWEDVYRDDQVFTLGIKWADNADGNLGSARYSDNSITFNGNRPWFIDDGDVGGFNHDEFDLGFDSNASRSLYQSADPTDQTEWYRGDVPGSLEYGYQSQLNWSDPAAIDFDLFTVALHEIGHHLGKSGFGNNGDGYWDFQPSMIAGRSVGLAIHPGDEGHMAPPESIMSTTLGNGFRQLPSASDILAISRAREYTDVRMPRKDYIGGTDWHTAANWVSNRVPSGGDDVYIRNSDLLISTSLSGTGRAQNLLLGERAWLATGDHDLLVGQLDGGRIVIDGAGEDTTLFVDLDGGVQTDNIRVRNNGSLGMRGGSVITFDNGISVDTSSDINGYGTIALVGDATLRNNGEIKSAVGLLSLTTTAADFEVVWDLDGLGNGTVSAVQGDLEFSNGRVSPDFTGTARVGENRTLTLPSYLQMRGTLELAGGTGTARLVIPLVYVSDSATLSIPSGNATIEGEAHITTSNNVTIPADSLFTVTGRLVTGDTTFLGGGRMVPAGGWDVLGDTEVNVAVLDWDGPTGDAPTTINFGSLTLNSTSLDVSPTDGHDGVIKVVNGGQLTISSASFRVDNRLEISETSTVNVSSLNVSSGAVVLMEGGQLTANTVQNNGLALIHGTVNVFNRWQNEGNLDIASTEIGQLNVNGRMDQSPDGEMIFDISGTASGEFDVLSLQGGELLLDGGLTVYLLDGFIPERGSQFRLISASEGRFGMFAETTLPFLPGDLLWHLQYKSNRVLLDVVKDVDFNGDGDYDCEDINQLSSEIAAGTNSLALDLDGNGLVDESDLSIWLADAATLNNLDLPYFAGDANLDGVVDVSDFDIWNFYRFNSNASWCDGDFNQDGAVDVTDLHLWNTNKFRSSILLSSVPEPSAIWLTLLTMVTFTLKRLTSRVRSHDLWA